MSKISYLDMIGVVKNYYANQPDMWQKIYTGPVNQEWVNAIQKVPGLSVTMSNSGNVLGYDYSGKLSAIPNSVENVDSNLQTGSYGAGSFSSKIPGSASYDSSTQSTTFSSGAKSVSTGTTLATVADKVSLGITGVAIGTKLGALIDSAIYSVNPDWWDAHYPNINPETWDSMATTEGGKNVIRSIFGLSNDDSTMYVDEKMLAYTYAMLLGNGAWDSSTGIGTATISDQSSFYDPKPMPLSPLTTLQVFTQKWTESRKRIFTTGSQYMVPVKKYTSDDKLYIYMFSTSPFSWTTTGDSYNPNSGSSTQASTHLGTTFYYSIAPIGRAFYANPYIEGLTPYILNNNPSSDYNCAIDLATIIYDGVIDMPQPLPGVSSNPEAGTHITPSNVINPTTGQPVTPQDNIDDILQALKLAYPDLFTNQIYEDVAQPDGTIERKVYNPVPYPNFDDNGKPITDTTEGVDPQENPEVNPENRPEEQLQNLTDQLTEQDTNSPDTGDGTTPPIIIPTGTANALYTIYNPSQGELNSFGAWLWSSNFVDQLLKLFNDPMQAIIGLHKVFVTPSVSGIQNIKVGYLDSGVTSNVVGGQYVTVNCGSVSISEYFGNVFDYDPFTQVYIYLPFVGIEKLDTGDVMRSTITVVYHVDVLTGACLVELQVIRDGAGGVLYTYTGNCAVQYPISSGSYMGIVASLTSVVGGVVGTIATGGALAPVALGSVSGVMNSHTRVQHSGGFSGNAGAMGNKIPYVIITRPQTALADNFPAYDGYPANHTTYIGQCSGFVKCETCHVENIPATDMELSEIEMLLKGGIII